MLQRSRIWRILLPGLLLAATGVGAGDLATGAFAGAHLGVTVLWAVWVGALLKFVLNEQLARHQLASGHSVLEAVAQEIGRWPLWLFLPYLLLWSLFVAAALISACGVAAHALLPLAADPVQGKQWQGIAHALAAGLLIRFGGFAWFSRVMQFCVLLMFAVVMLTAARLWPGADAVLGGLFPLQWSEAPQAGSWTLALIGGVGGTVTILCYGYWIREAGRQDISALRDSRWDLAAAYFVTALFGMAMVIIGSRVSVDGRGAGLLLELAAQLDASLGGWARPLFLVGAWAAMFSSLLGVLQAVPYLIADLLRVLQRRPAVSKLTETRNYRGALLLMISLPLLGLGQAFVAVQKVYAVAGALFMPALALLLMFLCNRLPAASRNGVFANLGLLATLALFAWMAWRG